MKGIAPVLMYGAVLAALVGCTSGPRPWEQQAVRDFYAGRYQCAMNNLAGHLVQQKDRNYALNQLRYASCALALGQYEGARNAFIEATMRMENFAADGEFKAIINQESQKDFLGDPYEQMLAFFYLAMLDYHAGEYDKALAGLKTALLADAGTRQEEFKADSPLVLLMMGKTYQRLGENQTAQQCFQEVKDLAFFKLAYQQANRALVEASKCLHQPRIKKRDQKYLDGAVEIYLRQLCLAAREQLAARQALQQAADTAMDLINQSPPKHLSAEDKKLWSQVKKHRKEVSAQVLALEAKALALLPDVKLDQEQADARRFAAAVDKLADSDNNLTIMVELGQGPYKYGAGEYGEIVKFAQRNYPQHRCEIYLDDRLLTPAQPLENVYYQASTRGGREMDAILHGKAVFKDAAAAGSMAALAVAGGMAGRSSHYGGQNSADAAATAALAAAAVSLTLMALSETTHPEADIRCWETLPNEFHLAGAKVQPGCYQMEIKFYDAAGKELVDYSQKRDNVKILPGKDHLLFFRSVNYQNPVPARTSNNKPTRRKFHMERIHP